MTEDPSGTPPEPRQDEPKPDADGGQLHATRVMSNIAVIESFADAATADLFRGRSTRAAKRIAREAWRAAQRLMIAVEVSSVLQYLSF
jgi:hypothetical protein